MGKVNSMMETKEKNYQIKEVTEITGLPASTIRYYDSIGLLGEVQRTESNYRAFNDDSILILNFITQARDMDFSLEEIKEILEQKEQGIEPCDYINKKIRLKMEELDQEIERLKKQKINLKKHLVDGEKVCGCQGNICHYIEGIDHENSCC